MKSVLLVGFGVAICSSVLAEPVPEYAHINFAALPDGTATSEGLEISDQYSGYGVWFSMDDGPGFPIIAREGNGNPPVALLGETNDAVCSASFGLTDPMGDGGDVSAFRPIRINFDPPVRQFRFLAAHAADTPFPEVHYFVAGSSERIESSTCAGTGGVCQRYESVPDLGLGDAITHIVIGNPSDGQPLGFTLSRLSVVRDPQPIAGVFVRVSQESAPGAGDFEENVLGTIRPWRSPSGLNPAIGQVYLYGATSFNDVSYGSIPELLGLQVDASRIGFVEAAEGLSLVVVHDRPRQLCPTELANGGGRAEMRIVFEGTLLLSNLVQDEPSDSVDDEYSFDASGSVFSALSDWNNLNTDGFAISGLSGAWSAVVAFSEVDSDPNSPSIGGLASWAAATTDGAPIALELVPDRRVELKAICLADTNDNCRVDLVDYLTFADCVHGPGHPVLDGCEPFDLDTDGDVDLRDFSRFGAAFNGD